MGIQPDFANATWVDNEESDYCSANPKDSRCSLSTSFYQYNVSLIPNAVFLGIFGAAFIAFTLIWTVTRRATAFNVAFLLGLACEILGYGGRIISWKNPWNENGFLVQICCLTIGPAFMAAGVYLCLRRIVSVFGPENSRIAPALYTRIFIPCDVVSLCLQSVGGALASTSSNDGGSSALGSHVMVAGLAFQVLTMLVFIAASIDFALRTLRRQRTLGNSAFDQNPVFVHMRSTRRFKAFLAALSVSAVCILWRSAFRVAELSEGWTGAIMGDQKMFIGFEGVLIVIAVSSLLIFHPGICIAPLFEGDGGLNGLWFMKRKDKRGTPVSQNDVEGKQETDRCIS